MASQEQAGKPSDTTRDPGRHVKLKYWEREDASGEYVKEKK